MSTFLIGGLVFAYGAVLGSFLNVVILRLHEGKSIGGRSSCPHCHHQLGALDLIPIFSYLLLAGKCRYCHHRLAWQYPAVEILTALAFLGIYLFSPVGSPSTYLQLIELCLTVFFVAVLIVVSVYDLRWGLIPDKLILPGSALLVTYQALLLAISPDRISIVWDLLAAIGLGVFFLLLIVATRGKGMGGGDLKLAIFIGLFLGFPGALISTLVGFLTGAIVAVILIMSGKKRFKESVPFGPFLALGAYTDLILGKDIWTAYLKVLGF